MFNIACITKCTINVLARSSLHIYLLIMVVDKPSITAALQFASIKTTRQIGTHSDRHVSYATDVDRTTCSIADGGTLNAWWQAELTVSFVVQGVNIFCKQDHRYLENIVVTVGATNQVDLVGSAAVCFSFNNNSALHTGIQLNITCTQPIAGQYVTIRRTGGYQTRFLTLCDVQIVVAIIDCHHCPTGSRCNNVTGCSQCERGKQKPDCVNDCSPGNYGPDCGRQCGQCINNQTHCQASSGDCKAGCRTWFAGESCKTFLARATCVTGTEYNSMILSVSNTSIVIGWTLSRVIIPGVEDHYGYRVQQRNDSGGGEWTDAVDIRHPRVGSRTSLQTDVNTTVYNLAPSTTYYFQVVPYRTSNNLVDVGQSCDTALRATTSVGDLSLGSKMLGSSAITVTNGEIVLGLVVGVNIIVIIALLAFIVRSRRRRSECKTVPPDMPLVERPPRTQENQYGNSQTAPTDKTGAAAGKKSTTVSNVPSPSSKTPSKQTGKATDGNGKIPSSKQQKKKVNMPPSKQRQEVIEAPAELPEDDDEGETYEEI